ncbi:MAG: hypothetical protein A2W25_01475 [candidate division Zixibacteria bacterium RBG_16_53_22]|nr:MAG: hypothetical protein A2W25_01475 [candidate division Zixibacteria bacterium RBG_16_53_22]
MRDNEVTKMVERRAGGSDPDDIILILQTRNQLYIDMVIAALENEGIPVLLKSVTGYHWRGMLPFDQGFFDYRLYVRSQDDDRAGQIVEIIVPREEIR